jgi:hypothetical protein
MTPLSPDQKSPRPSRSARGATATSRHPTRSKGKGKAPLIKEAIIKEEEESVAEEPIASATEGEDGEDELLESDEELEGDAKKVASQMWAVRFYVVYCTNDCF